MSIAAGVVQTNLNTWPLVERVEWCDPLNNHHSLPSIFLSDVSIVFTDG